MSASFLKYNRSDRAMAALDLSS